QRRIDHERTPAVVAGDLEPDPVPALYDVAGVDGLPDAIELLVNARLPLSDLAGGRMENEVPICGDRQLGGAVEGEDDGSRVGPGRDDQIVLELFLRPVEDEVHTGVQLRVAEPGVSGNLRVPARGVVADEVVALARQLVLAHEGGPWVGAVEA